MISVLIANAKGGAGKSTLATNLAVAFAERGHATLLADADKQQSCRLWSELRPRSVAPVAVTDWSKDIGKVPGSVERLVIDSPGSLKKGQLESLVAIADIVVVPILPSVFDHGGSETFLRKLDELKPVRKGKKGIAVVGNRMRPATRATKRLEAFLARLNHIPVARLRDTMLYPEASSNGLGLYDLRDARTSMFRSDWEPLLAYIEDGTI